MRAVEAFLAIMSSGRSTASIAYGGYKLDLSVDDQIHEYQIHKLHMLLVWVTETKLKYIFAHSFITNLFLLLSPSLVKFRLIILGSIFFLRAQSCPGFQHVSSANLDMIVNIVIHFMTATPSQMQDAAHALLA